MNLIDIYRKGMENDISQGAKQSTGQKLKIIIFIISCLLLSKTDRSKRETIAFINGNRNYEKMMGTINPEDQIFHGSAFKNPTNFKVRNSVFSGFRFRQRLKVIAEAIRLYPKSANITDILPYWLEFYTIYAMIRESGVKKILTTGISDRQTTWISFIADSMGIRFEIVQHGVIGNEKPAHKLKCDKVQVINKLQIPLFQSNIIANETCVYEVKKFQSVIKFCEYIRKDETEIIIGIATQCYPVILRNIVEGLLKIDKDFIILLMLHPLEKRDEYKDIEDGKRVIIEPDKKYLNLDIMITQHSTIVYDYIINDYKGRLVQIDPMDSFCALDGIEELIRLREFTDIPEVIGGILDEIEEEKQNNVQE